MRPRLEIRSALASAARELVPAMGAVTWRELASHACVGWDVARRTVDNMARAGELVALGPKPVPGSNRPMTAYGLPGAAPAQAPSHMELAGVFSTWARFE